MANSVALATVRYVYVHIAHSTVCKCWSLVTVAYKLKSVAHSGLYFAAYLFFFVELVHGQLDPRFAMLLFPCNKHRIRRFITLGAQNTWGKTANRKWYKAATPDTFAETECKKYVVITLQARACYRRRPIRTSIDRY